MIRAWARQHRGALAVSGVAAAALALVLVAAATAERVDSTVDPSTKQTFTRYRILGTTVEVSESTNSMFDIANALVLAALAGAALMVAALVRGPVDAVRREQRFFLLTWLGVSYVALDEAMELNETYSRNVDRLGPLRDLDLLAYGIPAVVFFVAYRDVLLSSRRALALGGVGGGIFVVAEVLDAFVGPLHGIEERLEPLASVAFLAAFLILAVDRLRHAPPRAAS